MISSASSARRRGRRAIGFARYREQHVQEVASEAEVVVGVVVWTADAVPVGVRRDARHFGNQAVRLAYARLFLEDVLGIRIERRHRADRAQENPHRVRVVLKSLHQLLDVLVEHRVEGDLLRPVLQLRRCGKLAEENQIRGLEVVAFFRQLFDRVPPVEQDPFVAVDVRDGAPAVGRVQKSRVVRHHAEVVRRDLDFPQVHGSDGAVGNRHLVFLPSAVVRNRQRVSHGFRRDRWWWGRKGRDTTRRPIAPGPVICIARCRRAARRDRQGAACRRHTILPSLLLGVARGLASAPAATANYSEPSRSSATVVLRPRDGGRLGPTP